MVNFKTKKLALPKIRCIRSNNSVNNTGAKELPPARPAMLYYRLVVPTSSLRLAVVDEQLVQVCLLLRRTGQIRNRFPAQYNATLFAFEWSRNAIYAVHWMKNPI